MFLDCSLCLCSMSYIAYVVNVMQKELLFNNRIRMWRAEKRMSQGELAELVGVSRQTISSIENLQFCPSARLALLICVALDKTFEQVFYFEDGSNMSLIERKE